MKYYLYVLKSESSDIYYVGISNDVNRRVRFHNSVEKGYTSRYRPWRLVYHQEFPTKQDAQKAEKKLKAWKSKRIVERVILGEIKL
ncbi:MAG: excinuclease ABC subunit C [Ignavibacteria bacterium RBG_13_36_8]|nr:MAG: excinuclease ABC subunit C [Ignavibacteria bacterium RBG_13_36_8]